jgi:hypothetical protein
VNRGLPIVYPLTDESWGVRRFFVTDPNGPRLLAQVAQDPHVAGQETEQLIDASAINHG